MARRMFDGYPTSWGSNRAAVFGHAGPASYTQVVITPGTSPVTGGDTVTAVEAGMKYLDKVNGGVTDDGAFTVTPIQITQSSSTSGNPPQPGASWKLRWVANKTATYAGQAQTAGSEAVAASNLSTFVVRLAAIGPK